MKNFIKNHKPVIIYGAVLLVIIIVALSVCLSRGGKPSAEITNPQTQIPAVVMDDGKSISQQKGAEAVPSDKSDSETSGEDENTGEDNAEETNREVVQPGKPANESESTSSGLQDTKPQENETSKKVDVCRLVVDCHTILQYAGAKKHDITIPENGILYDFPDIAVQENESAFDLISKVFQEKNIKMEYQKNPFGNSVYITGIDGIKEFDCGGSSGWLYKINGEFPTVALNEYKVQPNDTIELIYTCDMGNDL